MMTEWQAKSNLIWEMLHNGRESDQHPEQKCQQVILLDHCTNPVLAPLEV